MKKLLFVITIIVSIISAETNSKEKILSPLDKTINKYKIATNYHKALAVAIDSDGGYASGYAFGKQLQSHADKISLKLCNESRIKHNIKASCRIYMKNNEVVGTLE